MEAQDLLLPEVVHIMVDLVLQLVYNKGGYPLEKEKVFLFPSMSYHTLHVVNFVCYRSVLGYLGLSTAFICKFDC